jgi:hypothetical protein
MARLFLVFFGVQTAEAAVSAAMGLDFAGGTPAATEVGAIDLNRLEAVRCHYLFFLAAQNDGTNQNRTHNSASAHETGDPGI